MMKPLSLKHLQSLISKQKRKVLSSGFTLVELLAATVMSSIIISSLLYVMIDVSRSSASETARKDTLQDMRQSLEFITNDLKEAVYVYTGDQLADRDILANENDGLLDVIDASEGLEPILVFWKLEDVPYTDDDSWPDDCSDDTVEETEANCNELRIAQRTYTLVAYLRDNQPTDTWQGESVIYRYRIRKYFNTDDKPFNTLEQKPEYIDPLKESSFPNWPYLDDGDEDEIDNNLPSEDYALNIERDSVSDGGFSGALVDFVDEASDEEMGCLDGYARTPSDPSTSNSFYACVEEGENEDGNTAIPAENATVIVHLRGNPNGRVSFNLGDSNLPTLNSSVVLRGDTPE